MLVLDNECQAHESVCVACMDVLDNALSSMSTCIHSARQCTESGNCATRADIWLTRLLACLLNSFWVHCCQTQVALSKKLVICAVASNLKKWALQILDPVLPLSKFGKNVWAKRRGDSEIAQTGNGLADDDQEFVMVDKADVATAHAFQVKVLAQMWCLYV